MTVPTLGAVVLAAGASRRLGRPKQAVRFRGAPLVARAAALARHVATGPCVVVTGAHEEATRRALEGYGGRTVHNARWASGMASSLRAGLAAMDVDSVDGVDGLLVLLCDQWALEADDIERLVAAWRRAPGRIAASRWAGAKGPPAIFPAATFAELAGLTGDRGARALIAARGDRVTLVDVPRAACELDDATDLAALRAAEAAVAGPAT